MQSCNSDAEFFASKRWGKEGKEGFSLPRVRLLPPARFLFRSAPILDRDDTYQPCLVMVAAFAFDEEKNGAAGCDEFFRERGERTKNSRRKGRASFVAGSLSSLFLSFFSLPDGEESELSRTGSEERDARAKGKAAEEVGSLFFLGE